MASSSNARVENPTGRFASHPGYSRMFHPGRLTIGVFLPLRAYRGDVGALHNQARLVSYCDGLGFAAVWVRDIPLLDPVFGDAGQLFDPFVYLSYLAALTENIALATGSLILPLRRAVSLAKSIVSLDRLSGGRLVLGVAAGDRASEFPVFEVPLAERAARFRSTFLDLRSYLQDDRSLGSAAARFRSLQLLPRPYIDDVPMLVTGSCGQDPDWIATHADGWLTYPGPTMDAVGPALLGAKIAAWRGRMSAGEFRPHVTNEWIDLVEDADAPREALDGGRVLRTGSRGLIDLLGEWRDAGVNHAALGIQFSSRPADEVLQQLSEDVLPAFPSIKSTSSAIRF